MSAKATDKAAARGADRGAVTVEAAIALSALIVMFGVVLAGVMTTTDQLRCTDAAREAARLVARGERSRAADAVRTIAPHGATYGIQVDGRSVVVTVRADPVGGLLPGIAVNAEAHAELEPGVGGMPGADGGGASHAAW